MKNNLKLLLGLANGAAARAAHSYIWIFGWLAVIALFPANHHILPVRIK